MDKRSFLKSCLIGGVATATVPKLLLPPSEESIPVIDTHLHLWDRSVMDYPWLSPPLDRDFLVADFKKATRRLPLSKMVFVECGRIPEQYLTEVDWVVQQTLLEPRIKGMVAYFPLELGNKGQKDMEEMLERGIVRSIRRGVTEDLLHYKPFLEGVELLKRFGLSYDLNISSAQMEGALAFVKKFPSVSFILNHIGNPAIRTGEVEPWKKSMALFSELENVSCKLSGMITKADPTEWGVNDLKPYADHVIEAFTPEKLVYGGDWPVVTRAGSYREWYTVFQQVTAQLSQSEKKRIYYQNAERLYRI